MLYAVQTVFIDGKLFGSECMFEENGGGMKGCCDHPPPHSEEPMNSCEGKFFNRIRIYTDWFETPELARRFRDGEIT